MDPSNILNLGLLLVTAIGVGIAALHAREARKARDEANTARDEAKDYEARAVTASEVSAGAAQRSASSLEEAQAIAAAQDARSRERSDVAWEWRWDRQTNGDFVIIQNIGNDLAKEVVAQFIIDAATEANDHPIEVQGREEFRLHFPLLADRRAFAEEARRTSTEWAIAQRLAADTPFPPDKTARVRLRVTWLTPMGTPKEYDSGYADVSLVHNAH